MAKKHFGRLLTLAAVVGAAAAGVSYFLQYKSFHKELDEDFHDFEDDFDDTEDKEDKETTRSYVTLTPEHKPEEKKEEAPDEAPEQEEVKPEECKEEPEDEAGKENTADAPTETVPENAVQETTVTVEEMTE